MRLRYPLWENDISFSGDLLIMKMTNSSTMLNYISMFRNEDDETNKIRFFLNEEEVDFAKHVFYIGDIFDLEYNSRKIIGYVLKEVVKDFQNSDLIFEFNNIDESLKKLLKKVKKNTLFNIEFNDDVDFEDFLKLYKIKVSEDVSNIALYLNKFIELLLRISKPKILILKSALYYLTKEEIEEFNKYCIQNKLKVVYIEKDLKKEYYSSDYYIVDVDKDMFYAKKHEK